MNEELYKEYESRRGILSDVLHEVEERLKISLENTPRIDQISTRVKTTDKFIEKAARNIEGTEKDKYKFPLEEILDQMGARIVVYYLDDVEPVSKVILKEFREIEDERKEPPEVDQFGYIARHFICFIHKEIEIKYRPPICFFELQISTLFQHAWAEANHNLGYKSTEDLEDDDKRKIAWAAAQSWGADKIFEELWGKYGKPKTNNNGSK